MEVFIENLKDLIAESGKSLRRLADESGVSAMQYSRYLNGSIPTIEITLKIAKYFDCSLDYLFGLACDKESGKYKSFSFSMDKFLAGYEKLLDENNVSHFKFMKTIGYDESIIRHWKSGSVPRLDIIYAIAKNLGGSIDGLLGR